MKAFVVRLKGMDAEAHHLAETVGQGNTNYSRGWSVYANRQDAETMLNWAALEQDKDTLEVVEVTLEGL